MAAMASHSPAGTHPNPIAASFATDDVKAPAANGGIAHRDLVAHTERLERRLWPIRDGVWCLVGNGLSNQTFVEGPEGLIVIDTGESLQEMRAALNEVRAHTSAPVVATIYTHSHYVGGTAELYDAGAPADMPIWGHAGIVANRNAYGTVLSAVAGRGLVHQFGISLPPEGPDALVNAGLGLAYRLPDHAPFTVGFVPPTETFTEPVTATIAGLRVEMTPAPSDSDDSITIWFPELGVCVNNIVWPALFNVFAIRGEEYRDPRILLTGLDHVRSLGAEHLVGAHGPPLAGKDRIEREVTDYRDSIQFLWDQTVRGINRGLTTDELTSFVQLPERFGRSYLTRQFYGLAEHHVRQIHNGLRGWFDGDETKLLPLPPVDRCRRLIEGFGGADEVRRRARAALDELDLRWALELAGWLVRVDTDDRGRADAGESQDRALLAEVLRELAQRTTSSNVRNHCLTRALELEGVLDMTRHRTHRFAAGAVLASGPSAAVEALRVLLDPTDAVDRDEHLRFVIDQAIDGAVVGGAGGSIDQVVCGLRLRNGVAVPTDGADADMELSTSVETLAAILANKATLSDGIASGAVATGHPDEVRSFLACFDHTGLSS